MQLTRFDRWLRTRFVNEIHIYTLREPPETPAHVSCQELPESPGRHYRFRYVSRNPKKAEQLIQTLKDNSQMFTTRVVDRNDWYVSYIAPKGKSFTWRVIWICLSLVTGVELMAAAKTLWANPEVQKNVYESIKILKG